jgi:hypothetical protein
MELEKRIRRIDSRLKELEGKVRHTRCADYNHLEQNVLGLKMKALREAREEMVARAERAKAERALLQASHWDRLLFPNGPPELRVPTAQPPPPPSAPAEEMIVGDWADA